VISCAPLSTISKELRGLLSLAWPVILTQVGMMAMGVVDTIMIGHYGAMELASVAIGNTYCFGVMIVPLGILLGLDPLTSQAWGAGREKECGQVLQRGLVLAVCLAVPMMLAWACAAPVLRALSQPSEILPEAQRYALWLIPGALPILLFQALRQSLQGIGAVRPVLVVCLVANLFNLVADWALIYGHLGLPEMGVGGAGLATSLSRWVLFGGLLTLGLTTGYLRRIWPTGQEPAGLTVRAVFWLGLPVGVQYGLEVWLFSAVGLMMGWMGALTLAGHQIALNMASLAFMVPMGLSVAASVRVGQAIGRGDTQAARLASWCAMGTGFCMMLVSATLFASLPEWLAGLYTKDPRLIAMAAYILPMAALFQLFDGTQAVGFGLLRGTGDMRVPLLINLFGYYVVALPLGYWLTFTYWDAEPRGPWAALVIGLALVAVLIVLRLWLRLRGDLTPLRTRA